MTIDPFAAELRDGRISGRGATDTKGSMAAMLFALRECRVSYRVSLTKPCCSILRCQIHIGGHAKGLVELSH